MKFYDEFNKYIEEMDETIRATEYDMTKGLESDWVNGKLSAMKAVLNTMRRLIALYTAELPDRYIETSKDPSILDTSSMTKEEIDNFYPKPVHIDDLAREYEKELKEEKSK